MGQAGLACAQRKAAQLSCSTGSDEKAGLGLHGVLAVGAEHDAQTIVDGSAKAAPTGTPLMSDHQAG